MPILALLCSIRCPGDIILQMYDLAQPLALARNQFVAALADAVLIAHAGGQLLRLATTLAGLGKPLLTLPSPANDPLVTVGARVVDPARVSAWWPVGPLP